MNKNLLDYFNNDSLAASVWAGKYKYKYEETPEDMHRRMAKEFYRIDKKYQEDEPADKSKLSEYGQTREDLTEESIFNLFDRFNSICPQGSIMSGLGTNNLSSLSNCWVVESPYDSYAGILKSDEDLVHYFVRRGGVGIDISTLRPENTPTKNAAKSSTGAVSFMHRFSNTTREVAMNGRRAALLISMNINHPDITEFIKIKRDLISITGANISVQLTDEFMKAVENDKDYILRFPCDSHLSLNKYDEWYPNWNDGNLNYIPKDDCYVKVIKAKELWDELVKSATDYAEPGILFKDNAIKYDPSSVYAEYKPLTTNPCFTGDMRILTKEGYKTFSELEGKEVILIDGKGNEVLGKVWCSGEKEVIHLTMSRDGTRFCLDDDMCEEGEICVKGIPVNIEISSPTKSTLKCTPTHEFILYNGLVKTARELSGQFLYSYENECIRVEKIENGGVEKVYDFSLSGDIHWGVVEGVIAHNCGEQWLDPYSSCRLITVNWFNFIKNPFMSNATVDFDKIYKVYYEAMRLGDNLIELELENIQRIIDKIKEDPEPFHIKKDSISLWEKSYQKASESRRVGIGLTGLADTLAALNIRYQSEETIKIVEHIMAIKMQAELDCTIDMAILRGTFIGWDSELETNEFYKFIQDKFPEHYNRMKAIGRRNVSWSTVSPNGSVSILTQTTSGIEPLFQPFYTRRKKINPNDKDTRVDFVDAVGDKWQEYFVLHPKFKEWIATQVYDPELILWYGLSDLSKESLQEWFEKSPWYNSTANDINWEFRLDMQQILQQYTSNSISCTVNLPKGTPTTIVDNLYRNAWKKGLKGITCYVDGSRSGVLISESEPAKNDFKYYDAIKRPKKIEAEAFLTKVRGEDYTVFVGLIDNKPYEVFAYSGNGIVGKGSIIKKAKGHYVFIKDEHEFEISNNLTDEQEAITRGYSFGLRHGGAIEFAVEQLNKTKGSLVDFNKALARVLKKFIPADFVGSDKICPACGADSLVYEEGCLICKSCGYGKCG